MWTRIGERSMALFFLGWFWCLRLTPPHSFPAQRTLHHSGGWWGLFVAGVAFYIAAADVVNEEYQMVREE